MTRRLERLEFRAVGTTCAAAVTTGGPGDLRRAARALSAAKAEVAACERALSRFDPASDLSRLNAADGEWTPVDPRLVESLRFAIRMREDTDGRFDATVLPALVAAGFVGLDYALWVRRERPWHDPFVVALLLPALAAALWLGIGGTALGDGRGDAGRLVLEIGPGLALTGLVCTIVSYHGRHHPEEGP